MLGQGGFGKVYRGILPVQPAQVVAVKVLTRGGSQGDEEFKTELELLSRLEHKHLVRGRGRGGKIGSEVVCVVLGSGLGPKLWGLTYVKV